MNATHATYATRVGRRLFNEQPRRHRFNRELARSTRVEPAVMADGTAGVVVWYGDHILVMTEAEALGLANAITDVIEGT